MKEKIRDILISLSRSQKSVILAITDILALNTIFIFLSIVYFIDKDGIGFESRYLLISNFSIFNLNQILIMNLTSLLIIRVLNGYKSFFRSSGVMNLVGTPRVSGLMTFSFLIFIYGNFILSISDALRLSLINFFIVFSVFALIRSIAFNFISEKSTSKSTPILIYGAGQAGRETAASLSQNQRYKIIGFIDDDKKLKNYNILGFKVLGNLKKIAQIKKNYPKVLVIMAIVNLSSKKRRNIISALEDYEVHVKTIPYNYGALETKLSIENISVNDLIDRELSEPIKQLLEKNTYKKNILITGAGGSIGSEISLQVANLEPSEIIFIDSSEYNLYKLKESFHSYKNLNKMTFLLRDIQNKEDMCEVIKEHQINTIYHSAAYKHVPLLEVKGNNKSAITNNFFGTFNLCEIASDLEVDSFVLISSDKAVNPKNIMGASKRLAELSAQAFQSKTNNQTTFSIVRFGNVLNSSGSVVPLFWEQINSGGPVTVTHQEVNRYFMTIKEAASLVIQAGSIAEGGEVFLLDMGEPIKIKEIAERMIRLSGNSVSNEEDSNGIQIIYSGLREGEKLYEELLLSKDPKETVHKKIKKGNEKMYPLNQIRELKDQIEAFLQKKEEVKVNKLISNFVDGFDS